VQQSWTSMTIVTGRWSLPGTDDPPHRSVVGTPKRLASSIRRTTDLTATFPDGPAAPGTWGTTLRMSGGYRDLLTTEAGEPVVVDGGAVQLDLDTRRVITEVRADHAGLTALVGTSAGRGFRAEMAQAVDSPGSPLHFLLDDVAVVSGIAGVAWSQHQPLSLPVDDAKQVGASFKRTSRGKIACSGLRPGGYHEISWQRAIPFPHWVEEAGELDAKDDPWSWHDVTPAEDACFRRRRRIDVHFDGAAIEVAAHFRDSVHATGPLEVALHEYSLTARVHALTHELLAISVTGNVLPFPECPWAIPHAGQLVGNDVSGFRVDVPRALTELESCSHLNDMLRGLADVPYLAAALTESLS